MHSKYKIRHLIPMLPFFLLVGLFLFLPLANMLWMSFQAPGGGAITLQNYMEIVTAPIYHAAIRNSMYLSIVSSVVGLIISFLLALAMVTIGNRSRNILSSVLNMVSNFSGLPLAIAFIVGLGSAGVITTLAARLGIVSLAEFDLYSPNGLLLLYVYFQIPLGTLMLIPALQAVRPEWKEAAAVMRASSIQFWGAVGIPVLSASLLDTFAMLFANALTAYATPFMLMTTNYPLLPIKVSSMFTGEMRLQQEMGSALSLVMMIMMLLVIALCNLGKRIFCKGGVL